MITPTMLVILDGFGYRKEKWGNAIAHAHLPFWRYLTAKYPTTLLKSAGSSVGLPDGFIGNSEVGHLTMGAGRIIPSILKQFHDAIDNESFFNNQILIRCFSKLALSGKSLHLMGLLSDAGVHSHMKHLFAYIKLAHKLKVKSILIHGFLDGRDVQPMSAEVYIKQLDDYLKHYPNCKLASLHGRYYAMDRDTNWDRIKVSYDLLTKTSDHIALDWQQALKQSYENNITDEFFIPKLLGVNGVVKQGDGIVCFNFRPDRSRELTQAFIDPLFTPFSNPLNTGNNRLDFFITTTRYKEEFKALKNDILFEHKAIANTLLDEIAQQKNSPPVFITAETEKYAHVTYFFRGMVDKQLPSEIRKIIPSIKAKNYTLNPEMSASSITNGLIRSLRTAPAFFYLVNYANADMVGHSGDFPATVKACEIIDQQLALLYHEVVDRLGGTLIITADHGNAEEKADHEGNSLTAHTKNPVPFLLVSKNSVGGVSAPFDKEVVYGLQHVAPTVLKQMNLTIPDSMNKNTIF